MLSGVLSNLSVFIVILFFNLLYFFYKFLFLENPSVSWFFLHNISMKKIWMKLWAQEVSQCLKCQYFRESTLCWKPIYVIKPAENLF